MRKLFSLLLFLGVFALGLSSFKKDELASDKAGIEFNHSSWPQVLEKSQQQEKLIFVDVYAPWCRPCKMMSKKVFPQDDVAKFYNKNFVNYKVNFETPEGKTFEEKYPVEGFPSFFWINGKGEVVHEVIGQMTAKQLIREGKRALKKAS